MDIEKLEQLCELKEKGILTQKEFEEEKKKLMESSKNYKTSPQKGICWKNVGLSLGITCLGYFVGGLVLSMVFRSEVIPIVVNILIGIILTIIAFKMETGRYKNCPSPIVIFICTILLNGIACLLIVYDFLQIKDGNAVLKPPKDKKTKK